MKTQATKENIDKYYDILKTLYNTLQLSNSISMMKFSEQHNITKNLSTVLRAGGVIKLEGKARSAKWYWNTIQPTREMAIETLKRLADYNQPRKKETRGGKREGSGRKTKEIENRYLDNITFKLFWITIKVKLNYKTIK